MKWKVWVDGTEKTLAAFLGVEKGIVDLRKLGAWKQVAGTFFKIEKRIFQSEGATGAHGKWKQVTPKYAAVKFRKWKSIRILRASDDLFTAMTTGKGANAVWNEKPQELEIGTTLKYARAHQSGYPPHNLPIRRIIDLTHDDERELTEPLKRKIKQLIQNMRLKDTRGF
jgi:phage gpG-like protein